MNHHRGHRYGGLALFVLAALIVWLQAGAVQAAPQYILDCTSCHQMPPLDSTTGKKIPATGAVPGSHETHAGAKAASCVECHGAQVTSYGNSHRNRAIEIDAATGYSKVFVNQTSVLPPFGSCSTSRCHGDGKGNLSATPAWGSALFSAPGDCSQCHAMAPSTGNHPSLTIPAGQKHGDYYGTGASSCRYCHPEHLNDAKPFAHASSAGRRAIAVSFTTAPSTGGLYNGTSCATYCHSNGQGTNYPQPTWGATLPSDCSGCHGNAASASSLSGKHAKHVADATLATSYGCVECHANTVSDSTTISRIANHVNGLANYSGARAGTLSGGNCSSVYCHSDGKGSFKALASDSWNSGAALTCKACHGSDAAPAFTSAGGEPNYANAGADQPKANSHQKHAGSACQNCHSATVADDGTLKPGPHADGSVQVAAGGTSSFGYSAKTCSNVNCHGGNGIISTANSAKWGATLSCGGCHGDAASLATNAHAKHLSGMGYTCAACHSTTASGNTTIANPALHGDSIVEVAGSFTWTGADKSCATSCHMGASVKWNVISSGACGTCHAALSTTAGGTIATNAHGAHYGATYGPGLDAASANSCAVCHVYTTDTAATHVNGSTELASGMNKIGTCTPCHKQSSNWTTGRVTCESCHTGALSVVNGVTAGDVSQATVSGHGKSGVGLSCAACHDASSQHLGGNGSYKRLTANLAGANNTECRYCHDSAARVSTAAYRNMSTHVMTLGGAQDMACAACHDPHGSTNLSQIKTSINGKTIKFTDRSADWVETTSNQGLCQVCHTRTNHFQAGIADANHPTKDCFTCHKHNAAGGAFKVGSACDSCHGYPPAPRNVAGLTFGTQGNFSSARFEDYSGGGGAHLIAAHISPNAKPSDGWAPCASCHNAGKIGPTPYHLTTVPVSAHVENITVAVDPQYRFQEDAQIVYTGARLVTGNNQTGSCWNVSCHFKRSPKWSTEK